MAVRVQINGEDLLWPSDQDENWAMLTQNVIKALSETTLQKSGGKFSLTEHLDFGKEHGITAKDLSFKNKPIYLTADEQEDLIWSDKKLAYKKDVDDKIQELETKYLEKIGQLTNTVDALEKANKAQSDAIKAKDASIANLNETVTNLNKTITSQKNTISSQNGTIKSLNNTIDTRLETLKSRLNMVRNKSRNTKRLKYMYAASSWFSNPSQDFGKAMYQGSQWGSPTDPEWKRRADIVIPTGDMSGNAAYYWALWVDDWGLNWGDGWN